MLNRFRPERPITYQHRRCLGYRRLVEFECLYGWVAFEGDKHAKGPAVPTWFPIHSCEHASWAVAS